MNCTNTVGRDLLKEKEETMADKAEKQMVPTPISVYNPRTVSESC